MRASVNGCACVCVCVCVAHECACVVRECVIVHVGVLNTCVKIVDVMCSAWVCSELLCVYLCTYSCNM